MADILTRVIDSTDTAVGGGSAAALAGAMAAGLAGMVARLSPGRSAGIGDERYGAITSEADALGEALFTGAQEDADAYALVKAAYRLPRDSALAVAVRQTAIHDALIAAARVPLENAGRALRVLELSAELHGRSNPAAASDLAAAHLLAAAGVEGCLLNVEINLEALPGSAAAEELRRAAEAVRTSHTRLSAPPKEIA